MNQKLIKRQLFAELKDHLGKKEISLIVGPRQAGKTTLMGFLQDYLVKKGAKTLFLSLDFEKDKIYFKSQEILINKIRLEFGQQKGYVFIDEIQRKKQAGLFLKGIYDQDLPYKFIVSGSGSLELKEKIHESLAGRKSIFALSTVSFREFVDFKTDYKYENKLNDFLNVEKEKVNRLFLEYINFGGYPKIITEETKEEKLRAIDEIYKSYLARDISYWLRVDKVEAFANLLKVLAAQIGQVVNYSELSRTLGISIETVKNYLEYMEKTFIMQKITPFFSNKRKEITKSPVYYFNDSGLRNYTFGLFGEVENRNDIGYLFENFVLRILKEKIRFTSSSIHFWRTKDKAEVDFVIKSGGKIIPVEVKYRDFKQVKLERSFRNFIDAYNPEKAILVNKNLEREIKIKNTIVHFLPFWKMIEFKEFLSS